MEGSKQGSLKKARNDITGVTALAHFRAPVASSFTLEGTRHPRRIVNILPNPVYMPNVPVCIKSIQRSWQTFSRTI